MTEASPLPETGVRFLFTGINNGWELFRIVDMMSEDGDEIEITGNPFDYSFNVIAPLMLGFKDDVPEQYTWTITCDNAPEQEGVYILGEPVMEGQHSQQMLQIWENAYGFTFVIDIQLTSAKTVDFLITGDSSLGTANAFRNVTALVQHYDSEGNALGDKEELYFTSPDYTFGYDEKAVITLIAAENYKLSVSADVEEGEETYEYNADTCELTLYGSDFTITISVEEDTTDGIRNIYSFDAEEGLTVVNMQGVVLLRNGNAADLDKLEKGMYIVNGKKIVVRK